MPSLVSESSYSENPIELSELRVSSNEQAPNDVTALLILGPIELQLDQSHYVIGVVSANLRLRLEGLAVVQGSQIGSENTIQLEVQRESISKRENKKKAAIAAVLGRKPEGSGSLGAEASASDAEIFTSRASYSDLGIRLRPNTTFRIEDPRGRKQILDTTILNGHRLLTVSPLEGANRTQIEAVLSCANNDLDARRVAGGRAKNRTKEKLIQLVATRSLSGATAYNSATAKGITLSRSTIEYSLE